MSTIFLPIDTKSLYFNIRNDNKTGHTPTVSTPLLQGTSVHSELSRIQEIPSGVSQRCCESIATEILMNSRVSAKINRVFVFSNLQVNHIPLAGTPAFSMYIREETDPKSVHYGRQKVHYPQSLHYADEEVDIDNKKVLQGISALYNDYAFIIEGFEYFTGTGVLNFVLCLVGRNKIPYSKVFVNKRGVGEKFTREFSFHNDEYDSEIIALRERLGYNAVTPFNYQEVMQRSMEKAVEVVIRQLRTKGMNAITYMSNMYPYSLYDITYEQDGLKHYILVRHTSTKSAYFRLNTNHIQFMRDFESCTEIALVTDTFGTPSVRYLKLSDLNKMNRSISEILYEQ